MIEYIIRMPVTSQDLQEMADKAKEMEKNAKWGETSLVKQWDCDSLGLVKVKVIIDQNRARKKGLIK